MPARMASAGAAQADGAGRAPATSPATQAVEAEDRARQLGAAGADEPGQAHDLARAERGLTAADLGRGDVAHLERTASGRARAPVAEQVAQVAADHEAHHAGLVRPGGRLDRHQLAVAQDRHPVGEAADLAQAVADVDDAHALGPERA